MPAGPVAGRAGAWFARELADLAEARPRTHRVLRRVWRNPVAILVPLAAVVLGLVGAGSPEGDAEWFRRAGTGMVGPGLWDVFADAGLQIGPLVLLPVGLVTVAAEALGASGPLVGSALQGALVTWVALVAVLHATRATGVPALPAQWSVASVLAFGGPLADAVAMGHTEEILIGLLLVLAACAAQGGHGRRTGALLGVAACLKLWGALGAPVALVGRRPRVLVTAGVVAGLVVLVCYVPFFAWGEVNTFEFSWVASNRPGLREVVGEGPSDWALRVAQGAASVVVGCCVALRRSGSAVTVVLCTMSMRLLLDPLIMPYYIGPLLAVGLVWVWASPLRRVRTVAWVATLLVPAHVLLPYLLGRRVAFVEYLLLMLLLPVGALVGDRRAVRSAASESPAPRPVPSIPADQAQGRQDPRLVTTETVA
ncbi:hypothetical protein ACWFNE_11195 [Cellulomonas sp. NPDC055163]